MSEVIIVPRVKTEAETIHSPVSACGDNWWKDVRIRSPYKGTDLAFRTLPSLGEPSQVEQIDPEFLREMRGDLDRIGLFVSTHLEQLSDRQRRNIQTMLDRAAVYIDDAETIWNMWAAGFTTTTGGQVPPWALNDRPKGGINANIEEGHKRDVDKWKKLVRSALRNLRCAEEVAKKATIRARNKERHQQGRRFGSNGLGLGGTNGVKKAQLTPVSIIPEASLQEGEIDLEEEPIPDEGPVLDEEPIDEEPVDEEPIEEEPVIPEESEPESDTSPARPAKKKKDNTLLLAGAAAFGVLALSKR